MAKHLGKCPRCGDRLQYDTAVDEQIACPHCRVGLSLPGKSRLSDRVDPLIGDSLGQYEIVELLGRGGMAAVYKARQPSLDRMVAIKVLPRSAGSDATFVARFHREARGAAAISHPNIIEIHDVGESLGYHYLAMELVERGSLWNVLRREGRLAADRALDVMKQAVEALVAAHAAGIVHRDIKPSNILFTATGRVKVADFGLAKRTGADVSVTQAGQPLGTPLYIPPEVARGAAGDARSDLYSLGATFYHVLAGRPPFEGDTPAEVMLKHCEAQPPPLGQLAPDAPAALCRTIHRLLRKNPGERYESADKLLEALERVEALLAVSPGGTTRAGPGARQPSTGKRRDQKRKKGRLAALIAAAVGAAALILILVLALRGSTEPPLAKSAPPSGPPTPTTQHPPPAPAAAALERNAEIVFTNAQKLAARKDWAAARKYLDRLKNTYGQSKFYTDNRAVIDALSAKVDLQLQPKPSAWEAAWKDADAKAKAHAGTQSFGKALAEYEALAERFDELAHRQRIQDSISAVHKQADAAYRAVEQRVEQLLGQKKFAEARAVLQPVIERFGLAGHKAKAQTLLAQIAAAEKPEPPPTKPPDGKQRAGWLSLFDGRTLEGWRVVAEGCFAKHGKVNVENGHVVLKTSGQCTAIASTRRLPAADYEVELELLREDGAAKELCTVYVPAGGSTCGFVVGAADFGTRASAGEGDLGGWLGVPLEEQAGTGVDLAGALTGQIITWQFAGPYVEAGKKGADLFEPALPPETLGARDVAWKSLPVLAQDKRPWALDFLQVQGLAGDDRAVYIRTRVWSPKSQAVRLEIGSDDSAKTWLNRALVHQYRGRRYVTNPDQDIVDVALREGWNDLKMKIVQEGTAAWGACARFRTRKGAKLEGLQVADGRFRGQADKAEQAALANGRWHRIMVQVSGGRIAAWVNGEERARLQVAGRTVPTSPLGQCLAPFGVAVSRGNVLLRGVWLRTGVAERLAAKAKAEAERLRQIHARFAKALEPAEARVRAWDFRGAAAALAKLNLQPKELADQLAVRRDEAKRLAALKAKMIERITTARPRLREGSILIPIRAGEINGELVAADEQGITAAKLPTAKTQTYTWQGLSARSALQLARLTIDRKRGDDQLAAGLLALRLKDATSADRFFAEAEKLGAAVDRHRDPAAAAAFARATDLLGKKDFATADAALAEFEEKYAKTAWFAKHRNEVAAARQQAGSENLYAQAVALFKKQELFGLKPIIEKLKAGYAKTPAVTDPGRTPSFAKMADAVKDLGEFLTVRKDGKGDFKSIQAAIDAAPPKGLIEIQDNGPYNEKLVIPKEKPGLILRGKEGCWPIITSLGRRKDIDILVTVRARGATLEQLVLAHAAPAGATLRCLSVEGGPMRLRAAIIFMQGSIAVSNVRGHDVLVEDCFILANGRVYVLVARNCLWLADRLEIIDASDIRCSTIPREATITNPGTVVVDSIMGRVDGFSGRIEYCDLFAKPALTGKAKPGKGCFGKNPQFRDPRNLDYRLKKTSPCRKKASDGGDIGCRYTNEMLEMLEVARKLRKKGIIKF